MEGEGAGMEGGTEGRTDGQSMVTVILTMYTHIEPPLDSDIHVRKAYIVFWNIFYIKYKD